MRDHTKKATNGKYDEFTSVIKVIKITDKKWIYKSHNPAGSRTKAKLLLVLKTLIDTNCINISATE